VEQWLYLLAVSVRNLNNNTAFELTGTTVLKVANHKEGMTPSAANFSSD
jgi:hypothetical protein